MSMSPPSENEGRNRRNNPNIGRNLSLIAAGVAIGSMVTATFKGINSLLNPPADSVLAGQCIKSGETKSIHGVDVSLDGWTLRINEEQLDKVLQSHHGEKMEIAVLTNSGRVTPYMKKKTELGVYEDIPKDLRPFVGDYVELAENMGLVDRPRVGMDNNTGFYSVVENKKAKYAFRLTPSAQDRYVLEIRISSDFDESGKVHFEFYPLEPKVYKSDESTLTNDIEGLVRIFSEFKLTKESEAILKKASDLDIIDSQYSFARITVSQGDDTNVSGDSSGRIFVTVPSNEQSKAFKDIQYHISSKFIESEVVQYLNKFKKEAIQLDSLTNALLKADVGVSYGGDWMFQIDDKTKIGAILDLNNYCGSTYTKWDRSPKSKINDTTELISDIITIKMKFGKEFQNRYNGLGERDRKIIEPFVAMAEKIINEIRK